MKFWLGRVLESVGTADVFVGGEAAAGAACEAELGVGERRPPGARVAAARRPVLVHRHQQDLTPHLVIHGQKLVANR